LTWFRPGLGPEQRGMVRQGIAHLHRTRLRVLVPLVCLISGFLVVLDFLLVGQFPTSDLLSDYLRLDVLFLVVNLGALGFTLVRGPALGLWHSVIYVVLGLTWAALEGAIEMARSGNYAAMTVTILAVATIFLLPPSLFLALVSGSLALYFGVLTFVPGFAIPDLETISALVGLTALAFGISRVLYATTVRNILAAAEVKEARLNLIRQEKLASLGVLAAGIAHEINNPLSFIRSNLAVLERNQDLLSGDPEVVAENQQIFQETREGFNRITDVVRALGSFTRGTRDSAPLPYDLNEGVRTTVALTRHETKNGVAVDLLLGEVPLVPARGSEVNQVILNLLINSFQAVRTLGIPSLGRVGVHTSATASAVVLEVWNNGPSIPADLRERIFEPFFSTKEPGASMGLGLSLAWEIIVGRHGGTLELAQNTAGNVTFRVTLPVEA
jgi:signal transduction histidine kinase